MIADEDEALRGLPMSREQQLEVLLDMLVRFDAFCSELGLQYYLDAGTLLGAVRHRGFIPWDDDVDIGLVREDYDRLVAYARERDGYIAENLSVGFPEDGLYVYLKLLDTRTVMVEFPETHPIETCVYIDVFPQDGLDGLGPSQRLLCATSGALGYLHWFCHCSVYYWKGSANPVKRALAFVGRHLMAVSNIGVHLQDRLIHAYAKRHPFASCFYETTLVNGEYSKVAPRHCFDSFVPIEFEGHLLQAPVGYDEYLRCLYGDYTQLPPEEQRMPHHDTRVFWRERCSVDALEDKDGES